MNISAIVTPNEKGQIVIPKSIRNKLGITKHTSLQIRAVGEDILIQPLVGVVVKADVKERNAILLEVLKTTAGAWSDDKDWPKIEKSRRKIELAASRKNKAAW